MSFLSVSQNLINLICEPSCKAFPDPYTRKVLFNRNKAVLPVVVISLPIYIFLTLLLESMHTQFHICNCFVFFIIVLVWVIFCRTRVEVFNWFYAITVTFYFPIIAKTCAQNMVFFNFVGVVCVPGALLHWTGNGKIFLASGITQLILLNTTYKSEIRHYLALNDPDIADTLIFAGNYGAIFNMLLMHTAFKALNKAYGEISHAKQMEFDQQKSFILSLSHELRNPLNNLLGNIQLACLEQSIPEIKKLLNNANICGQVLLHLVNNILDSGKVEIGRLEVNPVPTHTTEMIGNIWSICSDLIKKKQLDGLLKMSKTIPRILNIDAYRLMQIMLNLVGNAIKFTERGSITVQFKWIDYIKYHNSGPKPFDEDGIFEKNERICMMTRRNWQTKDYYLLDTSKKTFDPNIDESLNPAFRGGALEISVIDTGCGMTQESLGKLFKMFGQVHEDPSKRKLGTGLGLFITQELCKRMNGEINVYSKPREGSAFIVTLPF